MEPGRARRIESRTSIPLGFQLLNVTAPRSGFALLYLCKGPGGDRFTDPDGHTLKSCHRKPGISSCRKSAYILLLHKYFYFGMV